jgi:glyoxylase-like metal-dependent hydrolase (beta-lactamase superfamily II)
VNDLTFPHAAAPTDGGWAEVAPGILWLRLPLPMVLNHVNCFALDDGDGWTILDTGMDTPAARAHWQAYLAGPLSGKPVRRVIATHHHPDHIGLAGWFQDQGAELLTTRTAWIMARMLVLDVQDKTPPAALLAYQRAGMDAAQLAAKAAERPFNMTDIVAPLPQGYTRLSEGDTITAAGRRWQVRLGQGHAPDHAMLWSLDDSLILGGDQLLPSISAHIGVYPTEPEADPLAEFLASIRALMPLARPDHLVLPGHKLPYLGLPARLEAMVQEHEASLSRLLRLLATPRRATECFAVLFKRPITQATFGLALSESVAHLNCLMRRGQVVRHLAPDGAWLWQAL